MEQDTLTSAVEAILFAAERSVSTTRLKEVFGEEGPSLDEIRGTLGALKERYLQPHFGFELRGEPDSGLHFVTKVANADWVRKFLATKPFRLGRSAMEVLAIIAYRQPITRAEIDQVRGIDSSHLLRTLMERGLVMMAGKAELPGRPVQYATTEKFLETVGLAGLQGLPPLTELEQLQGNTEDPIRKLEEGLERIISDSPTSREMQAANEEGLLEIDTLIQTAQRGDKEVFESPTHMEVAKENEEAVTCFQAFMKPIRRKRQPKTLSYEEVAAGTGAVAADVQPPGEASETVEDQPPRAEGDELPPDEVPDGFFVSPHLDNEIIN